MVQIITDSSTLHTVEEANALGVETLPLCVNIDDLEGRDLQMDMKDFYERKSSLDILGISRKEYAHSNFLYWLLNDKSNHKLGTLPLKYLLTSCLKIKGIDTNTTKSNIFPIDLIDYISTYKFKVEELKILKSLKNSG